jgi:thymidylate kinase
MDGVGKTTVLHRLRERDDVAVVHTVRGHEDPAGLAADLSAALAGASAAADDLGRVQLKVAVLYLQLCLFGPAERQAVRRRPTLLTDRHPLVDPLVYLPMFASLARDAEPGGAVEAWWGKQEPGRAEAVRDWLRAAGGTTDPWELGTRVLRWGTLPMPELLGRLTRSFGVSLPEGVVLLDLPVAQALRRTRERARGSELHETRAFLSATRHRYVEVLDRLAEDRPELSVQRVDCADRSVEEVSACVREALDTIARTRT